jgi:hypothetical protein
MLTAKLVVLSEPCSYTQNRKESTVLYFTNPLLLPLPNPPAPTSILGFQLKADFIYLFIFRMPQLSLLILF